MRCLYCGNELALLKKLTGYGEFCSEAHRQKYQEQYNRLALTRLLQAQEPESQRRAPLSRTLARPGNVLNPSRPKKELESGPAQPATPLSEAGDPSPRRFNPPDLSGFLPHTFNPASLPSERLSTGSLVPSIPVCLPGSHGGAPLPEPATPASPDADTADPDSADVVISVTDRGRWAIVDSPRPLELTLARVEGFPIRTDSPVLFPFSARYEHTLESLLSIAEPSTARQHDGADRTQEKGALPDDSPTGPEALSTGSSTANVFDKSGSATTEPVQKRPAVVINFAALAEFDPEPAPAPEPEIPAIPVANSIQPPFDQPVPVTLGIEEPAEQQAPGRPVPVLCTQPVGIDLPLVDDAFTPIEEASFDAPEFKLQTPVAGIFPLRAKVVFGPRPVPRESAVVGDDLPVPHQAATPDSASTEAVVHAADEQDSATKGASHTGIPSTPAADLSRTASVASIASPENAAGIALAGTMRRELMRQGLKVPMDSHSSKQSIRIKVVIALILAILIGTYLLHQARAARAAIVGSSLHIEAYAPSLVAGGIDPTLTLSRSAVISGREGQTRLSFPVN